ncbi:MAG: hypothetical protein BRC41_17860 [Cyanobacteria bacterium QH_9_48_43]|nr:MAG: hypothetical protein BRC41_17860 [Cyanobacteria bacterium QH_9_48_43]PSO95696.1 MAG: hypothetical protein BRC46_02540 [Cyanobacteria bacterium QS_6_48_18]
MAPLGLVRQRTRAQGQIGNIIVKCKGRFVPVTTGGSSLRKRYQEYIRTEYQASASIVRDLAAGAVAIKRE